MDFSSISDAEFAVAAAGVLVVGVVVITKTFDWIRNVIIVREATREYHERY